MGKRVDAGRFGSRGVISAAGVIASLAVAPPARAESRTHDGFYAAANVGVGYLTSWYDDEEGGDWAGGVVPPMSLWVGSTYGKVAIGGGVNTNLFLYNVAAFADYYPDPKSGFHVMPTVGWGTLHLSRWGFVLGGGVGYDFWVGPEVSMGVMARFNYAPFFSNDHNLDPMYEPALLYTVTYQ